MIKHTDWTTAKTHAQDTKLPGNVESIEIRYDGGRLEVLCNDEVLYQSMNGTQDCSVKIDKGQK